MKSGRGGRRGGYVDVAANVLSVLEKVRGHVARAGEEARECQQQRERAKENKEARERECTQRDE